MRKVALFNRKGGVGKSTLCTNLAYGYSRLGYKTLIIDLDSQQDSTFFLGVKDYNKKTFEDFILYKNTNIEDCIIEARDNLYVLPNKKLEEVEEKLYSIKNINTIFKKRLKKLEDEFDYIFIDCAPTKNKINDAILFYVDSLILPVQMQAPAVKAVKSLYDYLVDLKLGPTIVKSVIPNMYRNTNDSKQNLELLKEIFAKDIVTEPIRERTKISQITKEGQVILETTDPAASEFMKIFKQVVKSIG